MSDLLENETSPETIDAITKFVRLNKYLEKLNKEGVEKALIYFDDLNPKFFKDEQ